MSDMFNMFYHGKFLTRLEKICMRSFVENGHELNIYLYDDIEVPKGVKVLDANRILPRRELFLFENSPSAFSNIFRYKMLLENGGWWVDTDVLCLKKSIPSCQYAWAHEDPERINGAILKFPANDILCEQLLDESIKRASALRKWGELGPLLMTEILDNKCLKGHAGSREQFYPIHWLEAHMLWMEGSADFVLSKIQDSTFLHMWNAVLCRLNINLDDQSPKGSYFEYLLGDKTNARGLSRKLNGKISFNIRRSLNSDPNLKLLYEKKMGLDWNRIYPKGPRGYERIYSWRQLGRDKLKHTAKKALNCINVKRK